MNVDNVNYLKCWGALLIVGRKVFHTVLHWGFPNPQNLSIKNSLLSMPGYDKKQYSNDFNKDERHKIENGSVDDFDIGLLYSLIHRLCNLAFPHETNPSSKPTGLPSDAQLKFSNLLLEIKNTRNTFAHSKMDLSEDDMIMHIDIMQQVFNDIISEANAIFGTDSAVATILKNDTNLELSKWKIRSRETVIELMMQIDDELTHMNLENIDSKELYRSSFQDAVLAGKFTATACKKMVTPLSQLADSSSGTAEDYENLNKITNEVIDEFVIPTFQSEKNSAAELKDTFNEISETMNSCSSEFAEELDKTKEIKNLFIECAVNYLSVRENDSSSSGNTRSSSETAVEGLTEYRKVTDELLEGSIEALEKAKCIIQ